MQRDACWNSFIALSKLVTEAVDWEKALHIVTIGKMFLTKVDLNISDAETLSHIESSKAKFALLAKLISLQAANAAYLALGGLANTRVEAEGSMPAIKAIMKELDAIETCIAPIAFGDAVVKTNTLQIKADADKYASEYGDIHCSAYQPVLVSEHTRLVSIAGGGPDGVKWKDHAPKDGSFKELHASIADSLGALDVMALIAQTKSCAQAFKNYTDRFSSSTVLWSTSSQRS